MWTKKSKKKVKADQAGDSFGETLSPEEMAVENIPDTQYGDMPATSKFGDFSPELAKSWLAELEKGNIPPVLQGIIQMHKMDEMSQKERLEIIKDSLQRMLA